ncbi:MAG TPA: Lar family restriction alleviation protein, partial [Burkholderiaceae bacterium]|nr:Lar family restriction alleviation protein [Burkholderiaceae bacterium]
MTDKTIADVLEFAPRAEELATRLVAAGPKAAHVSASETHEIADFVHMAIAVLSKLRAPVADEREPLPCPFCGGRAFATYKTDEDDIRWHSVHCRTECRGYGKHGSEKDAIAAWNTRTTLLRKYPNDEEIIDLAVEPLGIDCDRMPHGVVVFARNL